MPEIAATIILALFLLGAIVILSPFPIFPGLAILAALIFFVSFSLLWVLRRSR
jgi:hypothetical protein